MDIINFFIDTWWFWIIIIIVAAIVIFNSPEEKEKRETAKNIAKKEEEYKTEQCDKYNRQDWITGYRHLAGLPIPENSECELWLCENSLIVFYNSPFVLNYSKIVNVDVQTKTEFKKSYVDKASGAIVGGLAFGAIGALIGGGTKEIVDSENSYFFTITYKSNETLKYIIFDVTNLGKYGVKQFRNKLLNRTQLNDREAYTL